MIYFFTLKIPKERYVCRKSEAYKKEPNEMPNLRQEHPKPQFMRKKWLNLNGPWQFETDNERTGINRGVFKENKQLESIINVPFCPESKLSGIGNTDFMKGLWYKRTVEIRNPAGVIRLWFGAVDYYCKVYINVSKQGSIEADIFRSISIYRNLFATE